MNDLPKHQLIVSASPHIRSPETTARIMWTVSACLIPSGIMSVFLFGISTAFIILAAVAAAVIAEWLSCRIQRRPASIPDGSAVLTGILLAYNLPPRSPLWLAAVGAVAAIVFGKMLFGGLGSNIFNPALVGRVFLMASFPGLMTRWPAVFGVDAVTAPTPLAVFKDAFRRTGMFEPSALADISYLDLLFGFRGGCIGEACVIALLCGAAYMLYKGYISWHIPASFLGTAALMTWIFGGADGLLKGNALFHLLSGGLMLGAFYMATDYVTSPITRNGRILFGTGCGLLTAVIRLWGGYPEGVSYAILLMNAAVPLIDRFILPPRFGAKT